MRPRRHRERKQDTSEQGSAAQHEVDGMPADSLAGSRQETTDNRQQTELTGNDGFDLYDVSGDRFCRL